jgi:hypothetical protein
LVCFRRQKTTLATAQLFADQLNAMEIGDVLLAPANWDEAPSRNSHTGMVGAPATFWFGPNDSP